MSLFEQKSLLAKLMATENITIRQDSVATACFDVQNRILTVPILDSELSKEVYDLFMGHECGHALWTPLDGMKKARSDKVNMSVLNVVEDSRIERKIKNKYPGIKAPFIKAYSELYEKNFFETQDKDITDYNFIDRVNLHCKIGASLALPFDEDERKLLDEVESTESFDDVIAVAKKICEKMKEQLTEQQVKVKVVVYGDDGDEENEQSSDGNDNSGEEADIEIQVNGEKSDKSDKDETKSEKSEEKTEKGAQGQEEKDSKNSPESGDGAGMSEKDLDEQIRSFTDDAYKKNENNLFSNKNVKYIYGNIPKFNMNKIMDYKVMINKIKNECYVVDNKDFISYRLESAKVVSYLVKEFELRKNADQMKRASTAKTGDLNMNRLYSFNFTDDIFKKISVIPQGKSHGLVMFLDWSGSMAKHFGNTVKQLLNLVMFCKKVNIPFEVYSFVEHTDHEYMCNYEAKVGDIYMNQFGLINLLSNRMSSSDFTFAAAALMKMSGASRTDKSWYHIHMPSFMHMNGTPLNEAVVAAFEIVPDFQRKNRLQIVNTVFLTDGEGSPVSGVYDAHSSRYHKFTHMVIRDPKTRHEETYERNKYYYGGHSGLAQTDCLIRLLKLRTGSHVIGFFVGEAKDVTMRAGYFFPKLEHMEINDRLKFYEKLKNDFRKNSSLVVESTGFDDYYVLRSNGLDTDDDEELTFKENSTTRGMVTAFSKYTANKISSRVVLNRFIGLIS